MPMLITPFDPVILPCLLLGDRRFYTLPYSLHLSLSLSLCSWEFAASPSLELRVMATSCSLVILPPSRFILYYLHYEEILMARVSESFGAEMEE